MYKSNFNCSKICLSFWEHVVDAPDVTGLVGVRTRLRLFLFYSWTAVEPFQNTLDDDGSFYLDAAIFMLLVSSGITLGCPKRTGLWVAVT